MTGRNRARFALAFLAIGWSLVILGLVFPPERGVLFAALGASSVAIAIAIRAY